VVEPVAAGSNRAKGTFLGSHNRRRTAGTFDSRIASAERSGLSPIACLRDLIDRTSDHPFNRLDELLPDHWKLAARAP
jgi:hypothetical protein